MPSTVVLRSSNLLKDPTRLQRDSTKEVADAVAAVVRQHTGTSAGQRVLSDKENPAEELPEDVTQTTVSVKLFLQAHLDLDTLQDALKLCWEDLKLPKIDVLILSMPLEDDLGNQDEGLPSSYVTAALPLWKELEGLVTAGKILALGVCGMSKVQLEQFYNLVTVKPTVDHINLDNCCALPKDLIAFAKGNKIDLLTHSDMAGILSAETLQDILTSSNIDPASALGQLPASATSAAWVLRFTNMIPQRGVTTNKSYAIGLSSK